MERLLKVLLLTTAFCASGRAAGPLPSEHVPEPLKPWIPWVLQGYEERSCPFFYDRDDRRRCSWPARVELALDASGGTFSGVWQSHLDGWVELPGERERWPQKVELNGKPALVMARNGRPSVRLAPGVHRISGRFIWEGLPDSLAVPPDSGLLMVEINEAPVPFPHVDLEGRLWLQAAPAGAEAPEFKNTLNLKVFRQVVDAVPLRLITRIDMDVSGAPREVLFERALLPGFIPLQLESPLPARTEPDGKLRVQIRPGHWQIEATARHPSMLSEIPLPATGSVPWPDQEIWTFLAQLDNRLVEIEGVSPIDPRQTSLPEAWKHLPAYRLKPGDSMKFKPIRRGDPEPEPDSLVLQKDLWLDFDGKGYTVNDRIRGTMTRSWRLNAATGIDLGRVLLDGEPQLITRLAASDRSGVEIRRSAVDLSADSRYEGDIRRLNAVGWEQDFQHVSATLHLPPGWRLFAATGVDNVPHTWLSRWTLLDLFAVLITALAVGRLWDWRWAGVALITLTLLWHEPGAPRYIWLNLLAAIALLRVLPPGRTASVVSVYRDLSLLLLAMIGVLFAVDQVRTGLYPQLEPGLAPEPYDAAAKAPMQRGRADGPAEVAPEGRGTSGLTTLRKDREGTEAEPVEQAARFREVDPEASTQTGPGLPRWRWRAVSLNWNGPVTREQEVGLLLLSPWAMRLLNILRVLLLIGLVLLVAGRIRRAGPGGRRKAMATPLFLVAFLLSAASNTDADLPAPPLLDELRTRLLAPPGCLPQCAQISLMRLTLAPDAMRQFLEIHAQQNVLVPLPGQTGQWLPSQATVDGRPADGLFRTPDGKLWLSLKAGRHEVILGGPMSPREQIQLPLPLKPHRVESGGVGWLVEGIRENGVPDDQLQLSRAPANGARQPPELESAPPAPFLEVERTLQLGLDWSVATRVRRSSPLGTGAVLEVPLLPGESVVTPEVPVRAGKALISLLPSQESIEWRSVLAVSPTIELAAPETTAWTEVWRADVSPIWHIEAQGIPVARHQDSEGRRLPEWRPWPGERVILSVSRPEGAPGRTLTIESSHLRVMAGRRATDVALTLSVRSSHGGQQAIQLPRGAVLQSVTVDGQSQLVRQQEQVVALPIHPGEQAISLNWRLPEGIAGRYVVPAVDLGGDSVNGSIRLELGEDRWTLLTGGPRLGPAVLFWSLLLVIALIAAALGHTAPTPLQSWQWGLLLIGLSQISIVGSLLVVGWLLVLGSCEKWRRTASDARWFNLSQVGLALLTVAALLSLLEAVKQGLLGVPAMQIAGNHSTAHHFNWYQDRVPARLPQPWVISLPVSAYRVLMLAWALWLAYSLLTWLRWGWDRFSSQGLWRPIRKKAPAETAPAEPSPLTEKQT
jgi:hypothetical protein